MVIKDVEFLLIFIKSLTIKPHLSVNKNDTEAITVQIKETALNRN